MEIIHVVLGKANPNRMNGVNKVVYQLATQQAIHNINVQVWGITNDLSDNYGERKFKTQLFKKQKNPFSISNTLKNAIINQNNSSVFHIHGGWIPTFYTLCLLLTKTKIKYVFTPHGAYNIIAMNRSKFLKSIYFNFIEKKILQNAKTIHCIGESEIDGLNSIFKTKNTTLLPYGFELTNASSDVVKNSSDFIIGFVGRLDIYTKGLDLLLDAFNIFHKAHPKSKLWILGDSDEKQKYAQMIDLLHLNNEVVLFGGKFGVEKDQLMAQMDVFAHPSRNEGLPASVIEAASMGIPCIVSNATNMASYIKSYNAGVTVENENINDITKALLKLYLAKENNEIFSLSENSKAMVKETFDWNNLIPKFNNLYAD